MKEPLLGLIVLFIIWVILTVSSILYLNSLQTLKKIIKLDFQEINKIELWLSCLFSFIVAAVISFSVF